MRIRTTSRRWAATTATPRCTSSSGAGTRRRSGPETGQTGDACALFDSDGDGNVNYAVCARIENPNANPTQAKLTADSPFLFSCDDSKNDRCGQPTPLVALGITAGTIGSGGTGSDRKSHHRHRSLRAGGLGLSERRDPPGQHPQDPAQRWRARERVLVPVCGERRQQQSVRLHREPGRRLPRHRQERRQRHDDELPVRRLARAERHGCELHDRGLGRRPIRSA